MKVDMDYFHKEYLTFRGMVSSNKLSKGQIWDAMQGLLHVLLELQKNKQISNKDKETASSLMRSFMQIEMPIRAQYI
ncbi:hypothetical protein LCGC14_1083780 [marine sediment metagenome]|uniref:Uncharacterized protein n=1 Tax=marine sediment metagenome TaxID=412755 RepID=A0A0F9N235_9ZZZZ